MSEESPFHILIHRVCQWRVPPNWTKAGWREEMLAHCSAAEWQARCDYDDSRGVPLAAFLYQRMLSSALTHHRREWGYALRFHVDDELSLRAGTIVVRPSLCQIQEQLQDVLTNLKKADRKLLKELFWEERTESEIAKRVGVSRQAISKRKKAALRRLHTHLMQNAQKNI